MHAYSYASSCYSSNFVDVVTGTPTSIGFVEPGSITSYDALGLPVLANITAYNATSLQQCLMAGCKISNIPFSVGCR